MRYVALTTWGVVMRQFGAAVLAAGIALAGGVEAAEIQLPSLGSAPEEALRDKTGSGMAAVTSGVATPPGGTGPLIVVNGQPDGAQQELFTPFDIVFRIDNVEGSTSGDFPVFSAQSLTSSGELAVLGVVTTQGTCDDFSDAGLVDISCDIGDPNGLLDNNTIVTVTITVEGLSEGSHVVEGYADAKNCTECTNAPSSNTDNADVVLRGGSIPDIDLAIAKTTPATQYEVGDSFSYRIVVSQTSNGDQATQFQVDDTLPSEVSLDSVNGGTNWSCGNVATGPGGSLSCIYLGSISDSQPSDPLLVNATANTEGTGVTNSALVTANTSLYLDQNTANDTDSARIDIVSAPVGIDLILDKQLIGFGPLVVGDSFSYSLTVTNGTAGSVASGFTVSDDLPPQLELVSVTAPDYSCDNTLGVGGSVICFYTGSLAGQATSTFNVNVRAAGAGQGTVNTASVAPESTQPDPNLANNDSSASVDIFGSATADLAVSVSANPSEIALKGQSVIQATAENLGPFGTSELTLETTLPAAVSFVGVSTAGSIDISCVHDGAVSGGLVTCTEDNQSRETPPVAKGVTSAVANITVSGVEVTAGSPISASVSDAGTVDPVAANNTATATIVVTGPAVSDLSLAATGPSELTVGARATYEFAVSNAGPDDVAAYVVDISVPAQLSTVSASGTASTCSVSGASVTCQSSSQPGAAGAVVDTISLVVDAQSQGSAAVSGVVTSADDPNTGDNNASVSTEIAGIPGAVDLALRKESGGATRRVGATIRYAFEVRNLGTLAASGVRVVDDLPNNVQFLSASSSDWACESSGRQVICDFGGKGLAAGESTIFTIDTAGPNVVGEIVNTATVSSTEEDSNPGNNVAEDRLRIVSDSGVDLVLDAASNPSTVSTGDTFDYDLTVSNVGSETAEAVSVTATLSGNQQFIGTMSSDWTCSASSDQVQCSLATDLPVGGSSSLQFNMEAGNESGAATLAAVVTSSGNELAPGNNSASASVNVEAELLQADLFIEKTASQLAATLGDEITYVVTVGNDGPTATSATVTDQVSEGLSISTVAATGLACQTAGNTVVCETEGELDVNGLATLTVIAEVTSLQGFVSNTASVSGAVADPDTTNNTAFVETEVRRPVGADLSVAIDESADPVPAGETLTYVVTVQNAGPDGATDVNLSLTFAEDITFDVQGAGYTCSTAGSGAVCARASQNTESPTSVTVTATAPISGSVTLNAAVSANENDPNLGNNNVSEVTQVSALTAEDIEELFDLATGDGLDPFLGPLSETCAREDTVLSEQCRILIETARGGGSIDEAINGLLPDEILTMTTALTEAQAAQFFNIDARLNELRGGAGGFSYGGLGFRYGNENFSLALLEGHEEGGAGAGSDIASPWGMFVNGSISAGDRDATTRQVGFDFDTYGVTAGVDYRLGRTSVLGMALGWAKFDSDDQFGSNLQTDGFTLTGYGSFYPSERIYVDGRVSYGDLDLSQRRRVTFDLGDSPIDTIANGDTSAQQLTAAVGVGYHLNNGTWNFSPNVSLRYQRSDVDAFTETGGGPAAFAISDQDIDSLVVSGGMQVSKVFSLSNGVLTPGFDLSYHRELENDAVIVDARLLDNGGGELFRFRSDERDQDYASLGVTLVYVSANGKQFYANYRNMLGLSDLSRWTINIGARFEF